MNKSTKFVKSSGNLFKDVGFDDEEATKLQFRSFLMVALMKYIQNENITQKEAGERFNVSQSRISHLVHMRTDLFSTDMLLDMMERVGFKVYERIKVDITEAIDSPLFSGFKTKYTSNS